MTSSSKNIHFLTGDEIQRAIAEVIDSPTMVHIALAGGAAMQVYGSDRLTKDVDFLSNIDEVEGFLKQKKLSFGGSSTKSPSGLPVDFIVREDDYLYLYREALDTAIDMGLPVKVIKPEYLAAIKMAAGRTKDEEDLRKLILLGLEKTATRKLIKRLLGTYAAEDFDSYVYEIEWRKSKEEQEDK